MSRTIRITLFTMIALAVAWGALPLVAKDKGEAQPPPPPPAPAGDDAAAQNTADPLKQALSFLPDPVARVGEFGISADEVKQAIGQRLAQSQMPIQQITNLPEAMIKNLAYNAAEQLVDQHLIVAKAKKEGYVPAPELAKEQFAQLEKQHGKEKLAAMLQQTGMTREQLLSEWERDLGVRQWIEEEVASNVAVSEEEIAAFYDKNKDSFQQPEQHKASHILVKVDPEASDKERNSAEKKAKSLRKKLDKGAEFAEVAKEESDCPSSREGGDLGFFGTGDMVPAFEKVAFGLEEGETSDVVETRFGYHIIKGGPTKEAKTVPLEEAKPRIKGHLQQQKVTQALDAVVKVMRNEANVTMMMDKPEAPQRPQGPPQTPGAKPKK